MSIFLSTFLNKIDKKGRVSVPSSYRPALTTSNDNKPITNHEQASSSVIMYPSFINECLEACSEERINEIAEYINQLDPYSEDRDSFATAILGNARKLSLDNDGRITLPKDFMDELGLEDKVVFVGKGKTFELWNEAKFTTYAQKAKEFAKSKRGALSLNRNKHEQEGQ